MKKLWMLLTLIPVALLWGADPEEFGMWSPAELQAKISAAKPDAHKVSMNRTGSWGNHSLLSIHRGGDGEAEVHETQVDIMFITEGEGTLVLGGTMVGGHQTAPGEMRGTSITGGVNKKMSVGDVFHIPAKVPHQMLVPKSITFEVVKVETK